MKIHIHFSTGELKVNEAVAGDTPEALVAAMQKRVAQEAGVLLGAIVRRMTPLQFAQEATRRFNAATKQSVPLPTSCAEFVQQLIDKNFATPVEE